MCSGGRGCCDETGRRCGCAGILGRCLKPCLLLLIAEGEGKHGYELSGALRELGLDVSAEGGRLYRALRRLEAEGLVDSDWDTRSSGPARRIYAATEAGREYLTGMVGSLEAASSALADLARRARHLRDG